MPFKKIFKKVTKPIAKVLNKVVPNEIKPFLPYAAAVAPYLLPAGTAGVGLLGTMKGRAFLTGGLNLASQLAQEGAEEGDFSALSLGLAGLQGALTAPGAADYFKGKQVLERYNPELAGLGKGPTAVGEPLGFLDKARNVGLGALEKGAELAGGISETLKDPFGGTLGEFGKAASVPFTQGSADLGMAVARKALQDYEAELAAFNAQAGADQEASDAARRTAIIASMTRANFAQDIIDETLGQLGLRDGGIARLGFGNGGKTGDPIMDKLRILPDTLDKIAEKIAPMLGYDLNEDKEPNFGGITEAVKNIGQKPKKFLVDQLEVTVQPGQSEKMAIVNAMFNDVDDVMPEDRKKEFYRLYLPQLKDSGEISQNDYKNLIEELQLNKKNGGIASFKDGGIMNLGGKEMDMRGGGFIPIGAKERADDVPARLSKNEFVMTADAVRAAGGGSVNQGAKRMYDLMHRLEARA